MATPNKFNKGDKVTVTRRNGAKVIGTISGWDYNVCTFEVEYDVDYLKDGKNFTMICVPQTTHWRCGKLQCLVPRDMPTV